MRITKQSHSGGRLAISLEGRLVGPWVAELRRLTDDGARQATELDLTGVAYADAEGVALLRDLP